MPFSGAGVYSPPAADFPAVTQTVISSTHFNNVVNDIATGLSLCLTKDGQQTATANIPFGGFRATNVGITAIAGSVGTPAINVSDTQTGLYRSAANELAVTVAGTQVARFDSTGLIVTGLFSGTQLTLTTAASRIIPGATSLSLRNNANNADNWLLTDAGNGTLRGNIVISGTGPHAVGGVVDTSIQFSILGSFTGAVNAQGLSVTSTLVPPVNGNGVGLSVNPTINIAGSGTHADFVGLQITAPTIGAGAATLTNATTVKIIGAPATGTNQRALWVTGGTVQFDSTSLVLGASPTISVASGALTITPATTITGGLTPNFTSAETAVGSGSTTVTVAHGLGVIPRLISITLRCKTTEFGYAVGDEVNYESSTLVTVYADTTNIGLVNTSSIPNIARRDTFVLAAITPGNWKWVIRAWK